MPRLFVAVELDDATRELAAEAVAELKRALRNRGPLRFTRPDRQHVTLAFLGDVPEAGLEVVGRIVGEVARRHAPVVVDVGGVGAFPGPERARVLWLAFGPRDSALRALASELQDRLREAGYEIEDRAWTGHVTLARCPGRRGVDARRALAGCPVRCVTCPVDAMVVIESRLAPSGSSYVPLLRAPLSGPAGIRDGG